MEVLHALAHRCALVRERDDGAGLEDSAEPHVVGGQGAPRAAVHLPSSHRRPAIGKMAVMSVKLAL